MYNIHVFTTQTMLKYLIEEMQKHRQHLEILLS